MNHGRRAFSFLELLVSIAIIGVLLSLLLPMLLHARNISYGAVCGSNLRQIGHGWLSYVHDYEQYPRSAAQPEWQYGGAEFVGDDRVAVLASNRPINRYLHDGDQPQRRDLAALFRCPADRGVFVRGTRVAGRASSILEHGSCFQTYGTSFRANEFLLDSTAAGIDANHRPLRAHEIYVATSRLLLIGDSAWFYGAAGESDPARAFEASWHAGADAGHMLAADGSVRFITFGPPPHADFALHPNPTIGD